MMQRELINFAALNNSQVHNLPFPYTIITDFLNIKDLAKLICSFPDIKHRGSIPTSSIKLNNIFQKLIEELEGDKLRKIIAKKFKLELDNKPTMLTLRGYTSKKDGRIHTDSKNKALTLLLYMNKEWSNTNGKLRLLRTPSSLNDYVAEIEPLAGTCLIFKVTNNCWHGHFPIEGKRLSIQLNYLQNTNALNKHLNHHRCTAFLKRIFPKIFAHDK